MELQYFDWSGVTIRHMGVLVGIDLFGDAVSWDIVRDAEAVAFCLTHGHPEHCGSLGKMLANPDANPYLVNTHLISTPSIIRHVASGDALPPDNVHGVQDGESVSVAGVHITSFIWNHVPLLPPALRDKAAYVKHLVSCPLYLLRIAKDSVGLPINAPMLGFHITFADGRTALNYAEGLHRNTDPAEVEAVARAYPAEALMFAIEPEDVDAIPIWLDMLRPTKVYLYEAHRHWRDVFGLPHVDLPAYADDLSSRFGDMEFGTFTEPGQVVHTDS